MKSRISIDVDYDNQPIIKIEYSESEDVRDKLVKKFLESFGSDSCWARFNYHERPTIYTPPHGQNTHAIIRPICAYNLPEESILFNNMAKQHLEMRKNIPEQEEKYS
jgi:hypothetical protein